MARDIDAVFPWGGSGFIPYHDFLISFFLLLQLTDRDGMELWALS